MRRELFGLACALFLTASAATADRCHLDPAPAATLLLPYFEVDLDRPDGRTTLFSISNAESSPTAAHVTFWTDWGVPTLSFDAFLTGYDVWTINLGDVFRSGRLPITRDAGGDPGDTISPHGNPAWDGTLPECTALTSWSNPALPPGLLDALRAAHTGGESFLAGGGCSGENHGDRVARGYVTVDDAQRCSLLLPTEEGYFDGETPVASTENQLWGDYFVVDPSADLAAGEALLHLEAEPPGSEIDGPTFYGSLVADGADRREPLADVFATRFLTGGGFSGGTDLWVWRDVGSGPRKAVRCGEVPWQPLHQGSIYAFDEQEQPEQLCAGCPVCSPPGFDYCFPYAAQRRSVADHLFPVADFGWLYLDLGYTGRPPYEERRQAWVVATHSAAGRFSVGHGAMPLHDFCDPEPPVEPYP